MTPISANPDAVFVSSNTSPKYVFTTPIFPLETPQRNRTNTAHRNDGENPNRMQLIRVPNKLYSRAALLPYLSAMTPHRIFPKNVPTLKAEPDQNKSKS